MHGDDVHSSLIQLNLIKPSKWVMDKGFAFDLRNS